MGYRASLYFVDTEAWDSKRQCKFYGKGGMQKSLQGEERVVLRLPNLSAGLYLLVLKGQGQQKTLRIVKQ